MFASEKEKSGPQLINEWTERRIKGSSISSTPWCGVVGGNGAIR